MVLGRAARELGARRPLDALTPAEVRDWLLALRQTLAPISVAELTDDALRRLLDGASVRDRAILLLFLDTGLRLSELAGLRTADLRADANEGARQGGGAAADQAGTTRLDEMAATTQSGTPSAERAAADQAYTDRLNAQAAATQAGAADQASTDRLDELAATTQSGPSAADEDSNELNDIGGPTPR